MSIPDIRANYLKFLIVIDLTPFCHAFYAARGLTVPIIDPKSEIVRSFCLFDGLTFDGVSIDHGRSDIAVAQQLLDGSDVIIGLEQVTGKAVAEGVGGCALTDPCLVHRRPYGLLQVRLMQMISPIFTTFSLQSQLLGRKNHCQINSFAAFLYFFSKAFIKNTPA